MVGGAPYAPELAQKVRELANDRILLPGPIYGEGYRQLLFNCRLYIHATEVGGTHPALVEAMGARQPVLVFNTPENREVVGDAGVFFSFDGDSSLENRLTDLLEDDSRLREIGERCGALAERRYSWNAVTDEYEQLLESMC